MLGSQVAYRIESSIKNPNPTAFAGSNPIHIQLESDLNRFVQITFPKQIVVAGLSIQTPEKMALKEFSFSYVSRRIEFPTTLSNIQQLLRINTRVDDPFHLT
jgi:hypothetical protein